MILYTNFSAMRFGFRKLGKGAAFALAVALAWAVAAAHPAGSEENSRPKITGAVFNIVRNNFPYKSQIDFPKMLKKGLDNLETRIDEVLVEWDKNGGGFKLVAGQQEREFRYKEPESWDDLKKISTDAFSFIRKNTNPEERSDSDIEYALVNGMLSTVDRHSRIIPPRDYEEFIIETEGSFTGLGIVISTSKGWITVVSPIEDTPAYRAGMKSGDRIVQIENESTVNMSIVEAVHRLRGPKGEPVNIRILRDSMTKPTPLTIVRDVIKIESVEHHLFPGGILYLKIKNFQRNTTDSAIEAIKEIKKELGRKKAEIEGIILDVRDNPGGLLNQAASISDMFLKYGTVFSVKSGTNVSPYSASGRDRFELREKTVVLINSGSASASEIVTGALKENDRALTMGTKTFGKGSIQNIFELEDGAALKLTIGNYLIPGEKSIHRVGITPDIFIEEVGFSKKKVVYKTPEFAFLLEKYREEREDEEGVRDPDPPVHSFKILNESLTEEEETPDGVSKPPSDGEKKKRREKDPLIAAARRIITGTNGIYRSDMLKTAGEILEAIGREEDLRIREKLAGLKVDWAEGENGGGRADLRVKVIPEEPVFKAGDEGRIKVEVLNAGSEPVYKLTALISSENRLLDGREFVFGRINPGQKVKWEAPLKTPENVRTRNDECVIKFFDSSRKEVFSQTFAVSFKGNERPAISYNYEIVDDGRFGSKGNGDGRISEGETVSLLFRIKNSGAGAGEELGLYLKNRSGKRVFLEKAIEELGEMRPGEMKDVAMRFRVEKQDKDKAAEKAEFDLTANDFQIGFSSKYGIEIPVVAAAEFSPEPGAVTLPRDTEILGGSFEGAQAVFTAGAGSSYLTEGAAGQWLKIKLDKDAAGWVKTSDTVAFEGEKPSPDFRHALERSPLITLEAVPTVTDSSEIEITGSAKDAEPVVNVSFFNNNDKIHVINSGRKEQNFTFTIPLEDGLNRLEITAKDSGNLKTVRTFFIRKTS